MSTVSIHAPREGCDHEWWQAKTAERSFNSRTPGGVRLSRLTDPSLSPAVSIHAPREGCDFIIKDNVGFGEWFQFTHPGRGATKGSGDPLPRLPSFNSRTPGGVRLRGFCQTKFRHTFQFTHPGRGATPPSSGSPTSSKFQFTHPGRGATQLALLELCSL